MAEQLPSRVPKKIDRTKRFYTPDYKRRVNNARRYKRERPKVAENPERTAAIRRWIIGAAILILVAGIAYLIYFAKFLRVNNLYLSGANSELAPQIQNQFNQFTKSYRHLLPQKNILLFSSSAFATELRKDGLVEPAIAIKKQFWHVIKVSVTQRVPMFIMSDGQSRLLLSGDGFVTTILQPNDTVPSGLAAITDDSSGDAYSLPAAATPGLNQQQIKFIVFMQSNLPAVTQIQPVSYEISSRASEYLDVHTVGGFTLMYDVGMDPKTAMERLQTVLQQPAQQNRAKIAYIDLRFDPKVYVCVLGQPCAVTAIPAGATTSSAISLATPTTASAAASATPSTPATVPTTSQSSPNQ
jgi:cell division septal protein FtsQ